MIEKLKQNYNNSDLLIIFNKINEIIDYLNNDIDKEKLVKNDRKNKHQN